MDYPELYLEDVRRELSELENDLLSDEVIVQELQTVNTILEPYEPEDNEELMRRCVVLLAAYFSYISYSVIAENQMGTTPPTSRPKTENLKFKAYLAIRQIAPVDKDLNFLESSLYAGVYPTTVDMVDSSLDE